MTIFLGDGKEGWTDYVEPLVILMILIFNAIVAIWQDSQSDKALEALKNMQAIACKTLRDGSWTQVDAKELVPGDIVQLNSGDCVPADIRVVEIHSIALQAGQAALTGESVSVQKTNKVMGKEATMLQD
jgi:P-type E1-E2 ATPase